MKFKATTHIKGKVYDLTQENMCAMIEEIDRLRGALKMSWIIQGRAEEKLHTLEQKLEGINPEAVSSLFKLAELIARFDENEGLSADALWHIRDMALKAIAKAEGNHEPE